MSSAANGNSSLVPDLTGKREAVKEYKDSVTWARTQTRGNHLPRGFPTAVRKADHSHQGEKNNCCSNWNRTQQLFRPCFYIWMWSGKVFCSRNQQDSDIGQIKAST